jgi:hypothetical protein
MKGGCPMKVLVVFYSAYGHIHSMAKAVTENELNAARFQGRHVATIAAKLAG